MKYNKLFILIISISLLIVGCNSNSDTRQEELTKQYNLWKSKNVSNYSFILREVCFCPISEKKKIHVTHNKIVDATFIPSNTVADRREIRELELIEGYFKIIQDAIDKKAYKITLSYDKKYGFPTSIDIAYNKGDVDEEIGYRLTHFSEVTSKDTTLCQLSL